MGKPIVYCEGCGRSLREDDFLKRRAQMADNRPWCADCRPISNEAPPVPRARKSSSKIPVPPTTPRRPTAAAPSPPSRGPLWAIVAAVAVLLVIVVAVVSRPSPAPPASVSNPDDRTERAVAELERFAVTAPPASVLARCAPLREIVRGTPLERRVQAVEDAARRRAAAAPKPGEATDASERHLVQIRELIAADRTYRRREEVLNMIDAARKSSGPRAGDFDRLQAEYERRFEEDRRGAVEGATAEARRLLAAGKLAEASASLDAVPAVFAGAKELEQARAEIARAAAAERVLRPRDARISGGRTFTSGTGDEHAIEGIGEDSKIAWTVDLPAGTYRISIDSACPQNNGGRFALRAGTASLERSSPITGDWKVFRVNAIGSLALPGGPVELRLDTLESKGGLMNLRSIRLRPE